MSSDEDDEQVFDERHGFWGEDGQWYERNDNQYTKDDHIYGVFAADSSNRPYNRYNRKKSQKNKPIIDPQTSSLSFSFVKGGIQTSKELNEESKTDNSNNNNNNNNSTNQQSILKEWESVQQQKRDLLESRKGPQLGSHGLPQQLGKSKSNSSMKYKHNNNNNNSNAKPVIGLKKDQGYAGWTRTEKRAKFGGLSFAEKYLQKHGFKGRLGMKSQGIANPIKQATKRKYNEGLGFNDIDKQHAQPKNVQQELNEIKQRTEKEKQNIKQQEKMWKIIDENSNDIEYIQPTKKRKINYQTASEYVKQTSNSSCKMEIYDYTTGNVMITTTDKLKSMSTEKNMYSEICPAFKHNVDRICDIIQEKRVILNRETENLKQEKHCVKLQLDTLTKEKSRTHEKNNKLYELKDLIQQLKGKKNIVDLTGDNNMNVNENENDINDHEEISSDFMYDIFEKIQSKFYIEYLKYKLWKLFPNILFPQIKKELKTWTVMNHGQMDWFIGMLTKWKGLLSNNYVQKKRKRINNKKNVVKKDVYYVLIEDIIIPKIRTELYEWHPLEHDINHQFVELFIKLKDIFPITCYQTLLNHLIIPRLNHIFEQRSDNINDDIMTQCIMKWKFIFGMQDMDIDDILTKNICKKMKRFWRAFNGKNEKEHLLYIQTLKQWECVLLDIMDIKTMDNMYNVITQTIVSPKLNNILTDCVHKMDVHKHECVQRFEFVHKWYENDIFTMNQYLKLIRNGFFNKWLFLIYDKLKDLEENINRNNNMSEAVDDIKFIWNDLFAVINRDIFGPKQHEKICNLLQCDMIEKYLNCCLDMINVVISNEILLPSFDMIKNILMESLIPKTAKKRLKKKNKKMNKGNKNKNKSEWMEEYKNDRNNALNHVNNSNIADSISIVELIEIKAQNLGIEFYLDFNKQFDGKKVYKFGKLSICFYDKSIFAKQDNEWKPVDIQDLIRMC